MPDTPVIVAIAALITSIIGWITSGLVLSDRKVRTAERITKAQTTADSAMQEAAEAQNDVAKLREAYDEMTRDLHDELVRMSRENGETGAAIRQHVTDVAIWGRDNFARKDDIAAAMTEMKSVQLAAITEIKSVQKDMNTKLDGISKDIRDNHGRR